MERWKKEDRGGKREVKRSEKKREGEITRKRDRQIKKRKLKYKDDKKRRDVKGE